MLATLTAINQYFKLNYHSTIADDTKMSSVKSSGSTMFQISQNS